MNRSNVAENVRGEFAQRHIGPCETEERQMLQQLGLKSRAELIDAAVPAEIRLEGEMQLPLALTEAEALATLRAMLSKNRVLRSFIGLGYHGCITPGPIQRHILENPGWYTQYTPYQAEISQGRLEAMLNFQTMITDLTALPIANASMLDEGTAAAEAMAMAFASKGSATNNRFFVDAGTHSQTLDVLRTRAEPLGIELVEGEGKGAEFGGPLFGALAQYPATDGSVRDWSAWCASVHAAGGLAILAADTLSLTLLKAPGEMGADIAVGNTQRFGVPFGFGGPHAAYLATRDELKRIMPGRLVGVSKDATGRPAYRLSLQTREQHIRREKATSNICTAQVLLAVMASMYAVYHGPQGLKKIAARIHRETVILAAALRRVGVICEGPFFDTLRAVLPEGKTSAEVLQRALSAGINLRALDAQTVLIALDETVTLADLEAIFTAFAGDGAKLEYDVLAGSVQQELPSELLRSSAYLTHPVFNTFHTETELMRYMRRLESRDLSLTTSMIPLGSCTMKLNAASEMFPLTWPEVAQLHPFAPREQTLGYLDLFRSLEQGLSAITGFPAISLQPNAGSQGEYAGLLVIRAYHQSRGDMARNVCLIPKSAHGTNPASAAMAGMKVVPVDCDESGNIDLEDLRRKAAEHAADLSALMVTYPSTHGVFEAGIREICKIIHEHGGQVYMDGANLNAQVGLCNPAEIGADVCHLNLHKTFCIPHGGGGPGMGPIGVAAHLAPFLPGHPHCKVGGESGIHAISAAPWGSASILTISWMYIAMMGATGLREATEFAILNANYIARRLGHAFKVLYTGPGGWVAHECILDLREWKQRAGIEVEDVAKRLMDYGFHAPTMSWPVPGTLMIEPTESESQAELDRFCEAMLGIYEELCEVENGKLDRADNPLKHAPHPARVVVSDDWKHGYSRERAAYPSAWTREHKFWPSVARIDNVYGDRNLFCSCIPMNVEG